MTSLSKSVLSNQFHNMISIRSWKTGWSCHPEMLSKLSRFAQHKTFDEIHATMYVIHMLYGIHSFSVVYIYTETVTHVLCMYSTCCVEYIHALWFTISICDEIHTTMYVIHMIYVIRTSSMVYIPLTL